MRNINMNRIEELLAQVKLDELLNAKRAQEEEEKADSQCIKTILIVLGVILIAAVVAYAVYKFVTPDYLEDFDDDFDDDFDEDFFDDEEDSDDDLMVDESESDK